MATPRAMTMTRSNALVATRVTTRRRTATTRRARATRPKIESLGGFGPNIDAKEIQRRMAEKQRKIDENKRKARGAKEASTAFGARREFQRTISSARPSRAGRTMPGGGVAAGTTSSKTKTTRAVRSATLSDARHITPAHVYTRLPFQQTSPCIYFDHA